MKQLIEANKKLLDEKFSEQYPNGIFIVGKDFGNDYLAWRNRRRTSRITPAGIVCYQKGNIVYNRFWDVSTGLKSYDNLEAVLKQARKLKFSEQLITNFIKRYDNRPSIRQDFFLHQEGKYTDSKIEIVGKQDGI